MPHKSEGHVHSTIPMRIDKELYLELNSLKKQIQGSTKGKVMIKNFSQLLSYLKDHSASSVKREFGVDLKKAS